MVPGEVTEGEALGFSVVEDAEVGGVQVQHQLTVERTHFSAGDKVTSLIEGLKDSIYNDMLIYILSLFIATCFMPL